MDIGHEAETIFRLQATKIYNAFGSEGILNILIEMIESEKALAEKFGELTEKDDPLMSKQMKELCAYHSMVLPALTLMRNKIRRTGNGPKE